MNNEPIGFVVHRCVEKTENGRDAIPQAKKSEYRNRSI